MVLSEHRMQRRTETFVYLSLIAPFRRAVAYPIRCLTVAATALPKCELLLRIPPSAHAPHQILVHLLRRLSPFVKQSITPSTRRLLRSFLCHAELVSGPAKPTGSLLSV